MKQKASLPKGTRDFSSLIMVKRNYIIGIIRKAFEKYGYLPIETPAMENLSTLTGKYGDEGDRLIFKILNSGDFLSKTNFDSSISSKELTKQISSKALRYDLTVPFARFVSQNRNDLIFPFKRYQIQNVWRADRPQKGRYREFYQCDADIIGSNSILNEIELIQLYYDVFTNLGLTDFTIFLNNRKILSSIFELVGEDEKLLDFVNSLDKLDDIGVNGVKEEMIKKGISKELISKSSILFNLKGDNSQILSVLKDFVSNSTIGQKGVEELDFIINTLQQLGGDINNKIKINLSLARGLDYYTGTIIEVKSNSVEIGSVGGGGRYDDLTSIFGLKDVSGVGISFGLDRIYHVLDELNLFPEIINQNLQVMFTNFGDNELIYSLKLLNNLRIKGVNAEIYPDSIKIKKQLNYANKKNIPFVVLAGPEEIEKNTIILKNMNDGSQKVINFEDLLNVFIK